MLFTSPPQELGPLHFRVHRLPAQLIAPAHDPGLAQVMSQPVAWPQSTPPAQPFCPQVIWQGI
jgi:hypothetical protein